MYIYNYFFTEEAFPWDICNVMLNEKFSVNNELEFTGTETAVAYFEEKI